MKKFLIALLTVGVVGCVSTPVPINQAKPVPADRYYWTEKPKTTNPGKLIIVRDTGFVGGGATLKLFIDDKRLAAIAIGEKTEVLLDANPDEYVIHINDGDFIVTSANQVVRPNQTYYYRIYSDPDAYFHISRVKNME